MKKIKNKRLGVKLTFGGKNPGGFKLLRKRPTKEKALGGTKLLRKRPGGRKRPKEEPQL